MRRFLPLILAILGAAGATAEAQPVAPELNPNLGWLNTDRPLRFSDELKGHVVVLDFWTYCCINCMHVLPDLEYLEMKYADEPVVVIGVHSAKFASEGERQAIRNAVLRYDVHHPVVIDDRMKIWRKYGVRAWPSFVVIGTDGRAAKLPARDGGFDYVLAGEGHRDALDAAIAEALRAGRERATIADKRVTLRLDASVAPPGGLAFPGKVLADHQGGRLFIADSSSDRVLICTIPDDNGRARALHTVGDGQRGLRDGPADHARFHDPQGMALHPGGEWLYVADTRNHAVRRIRLDDGTVETVAGNGEQSSDRAGGQAGTAQGLSSPWALAFSPDGGTLFVAMAGTHQLWQIDTDSRVARALAGSGRENIVDGPAPDAELAQPSALALASDGRTLYFADSETSAIRALDLETRVVRTIIGEGLFEFGDINGLYPDARMQHPLGLALLPSLDGDRLLVADTYNSKIKVVDPSARAVSTWRFGPDLTLSEPGGLSIDTQAPDGKRLFIADTNNHRIVVIDVMDRRWHEVMLDGVGAPASIGPDDGPPGQAATDEVTAVQVNAPAGQRLTLHLNPEADPDTQPNPEAPCVIRITDASTGRLVAQRTSREQRFPLTIVLPRECVAPGSSWRVDVTYAHCTHDDHAVCIPADASWLLRIGEGEATSVTLPAPARTP